MLHQQDKKNPGEKSNILKKEALTAFKNQVDSLSESSSYWKYRKINRRRWNFRGAVPKQESL